MASVNDPSPLLDSTRTIMTNPPKRTLGMRDQTRTKVTCGDVALSICGS